MAAGDGSVEDAEKFCSDIAGHPGIPRRIKPPDLSFPRSFLFLPVIVIELVNVLFLIFKVKRVATSLEGYYI